MKIKASFTIEAVFIMPIVLFTMVFILYLSFYLHDYCRIRGITDGALHKASMNLKHEADIITGRVNYEEINNGLISKIFEKPASKEKDIENYINKLLSKGLIATEITDVNASMGILNLSVRVEGSFNIPLKGLQWIISSDNTLLVEAKSSNHNPGDSVRISEVILDTGSKIKGFDKIKESIEKLLPD